MKIYEESKCFSVKISHVFSKKEKCINFNNANDDEQITFMLRFRRYKYPFETLNFKERCFQVLYWCKIVHILYDKTHFYQEISIGSIPRYRLNGEKMCLILLSNAVIL